MNANRILSIAIELKKDKQAYDEYCKQVLSNKQILSRISKECVEEYHAIPLNTIFNSLKTESINKESNEQLESKNVEENSLLGAPIRYDILLETKVPASNSIDLVINLEAQSKDDPGYPLLHRALYYSSRLLDRQKGTVPAKAFHYGTLKKVYSIWICLHHSKKKNGAINHYSMQETCHEKAWISPKKDYDLLEIIMIYLVDSYDYEHSKKDIMGLLYTLFLSDETADRKKKRLEEIYGIKGVNTDTQEVDEMCNFSDYIVEKSIRKGWEQGLKDGIEEGSIQGKHSGLLEASIAHVKALVSSGKFDIQEAIVILGISKELRPLVLRELSKEN